MLKCAKFRLGDFLRSVTAVAGKGIRDLNFTPENSHARKGGE